jgi:hypothetical protein
MTFNIPSVRKTLITAAATAASTMAAVRWAGHLVTFIHNLQTASMGAGGIAAGGVVVVNTASDVAVRRLLSRVLKIKSEAALHFLGALGGLASSAILIRYEILPLASAGTPLIVVGSLAFLIFKLILWKQATNEKEVDTKPKESAKTPKSEQSDISESLDLPCLLDEGLTSRLKEQIEKLKEKNKKLNKKLKINDKELNEKNKNC